MNWLRNWLRNGLRKWQIWAAGGAVVLIGIMAIWFVFFRADPIQFKTVKVEKGSVTASVTASGTVNPVIIVQVGSQASGQVKEIFVDFNSEVKEGQLIARIDPETFEYKVRQAQADLDAARAQVMVQRAEYARQRVNLANAKIDMERKLKLVESGFLSPAERDTVKTVYNAQLEQVNFASSTVKNMEAIVKQKSALLSQAKVDLERTAIKSPVNGIVIKKSVEQGQTVAASLQAPELFLIAENLTDMQVETSIDESEIGRIQEGQKATFTVDSYPGRTFEGAVTQIRKAAQNVSNVITYVVIVSAPNPKKELLPGMTANVRIVLATHDNVTLIPNSALRFRMPNTDKAAKNTNQDAAQKTPAAVEKQIQTLRERFVKELSLNDEQKAKLDIILAATRTKMEDANHGQESERKRSLDIIRTEMQQQVLDMLNEEQKKVFETLVASFEVRRANTTQGRIYIMDDNRKPQELNVRLGLSDGSLTEVLSPDMEEGTEVIVGIQSAQGGASSSGPRGPRMF